MTGFVVWNDGQGNSNLDPPLDAPFEISAAKIVFDVDGDGDETLSIIYDKNALVERDRNDG